MSLTSRAGRRFAVGFGLATAAALVPAVALAAPSAPIASARAAAHASTCTSVHTRIWYGQPGDAAAGHSFIQLELSNIGHATCTFFGFPGVSALNSHGHQVGHPATHTGRRIGVTLRPGGTTHVVLVITDASIVCSHPVRATDLRVFPPGQFHSQTVPLATGQCLGKSVLSVDSVHPGTGIPGFSHS